jgi:hypothetical protein
MGWFLRKYTRGRLRTQLYVSPTTHQARVTTGYVIIYVVVQFIRPLSLSVFVHLTLFLCPHFAPLSLSFPMSLNIIFLFINLSTCLSLYCTSIIPFCLPSVSDYLSIYLYSPSWGLGRFFSFLILYTFGGTPWTGNQPVVRPLPTHRTSQTQNKRTRTSMP